MTKEVFFYFDIFKNNGLGHYSRCSVLNYQLNKKWEVQQWTSFFILSHEISFTPISNVIPRAVRFLENFTNSSKPHFF